MDVKGHGPDPRCTPAVATSASIQRPAKMERQRMKIEYSAGQGLTASVVLAGELGLAFDFRIDDSLFDVLNGHTVSYTSDSSYRYMTSRVLSPHQNDYSDCFRP